MTTFKRSVSELLVSFPCMYYIIQTNPELYSKVKNTKRSVDMTMTFLRCLSSRLYVEV